MRNKYIILAFIMIVFSSCSQKKFESVRFYINSNNIEKAELILNNLNKQEKESFDYYYLTGIVLVKKSVAGYKRDALNNFLRANEFDSNNYLNNLMIAKMFIEVNNLSDAKIYADKARKLYSRSEIKNYDEDIYYLLAKIYMKQKNYDSAFDNICLSSFQDNENIIFLKTEISDLRNKTDLLDRLVENYKIQELLSDEMQLNYLHYLFLTKQIKKAEDLIDDLFMNDSVSLLYYSNLYKAFIYLLNKDYESAQNCIENSYDYTIDDTLFFRYKIKFFLSYVTENNQIKIFNAFLFYKFFYEKNEQDKITAKEDLSEIYEYFKDDIYFNLLTES